MGVEILCGLRSWVLGRGCRRSFQSEILLVRLLEDIEFGSGFLDQSGWRGGCPDAYT